jgi:replicative DNA helicase
MGKSAREVMGATSVYSAMASFREQLDRDEADRLRVGIPRIDRATRGVEPGELFFLLGRTASLKTMAALNILRFQVKTWERSAFLLVELEMPRAQLIRRLLRMEFNRSDELLDVAIKAGTINLERFCEKYQHLYFVDQGAVSLAQIERYARDLQQQLGDVVLKAIHIDHAGLIRPEHGTGSSYERASATAIGLKQLARTLALPVFCIVQANRGGIKTDGEPVNLEAARDSGAYEENADFVLSFSAITEPAGEAPFVKMRLAKNRRGPHVPTVLGFDPVTLKMAERTEGPHAH